MKKQKYIGNKTLISVILPCRDEEEALGNSIIKIKEVARRNNINLEIIVSDSSKDNSPKIAKKNKVRLIKHNLNGYGSACIEGFKRAKGKYLFLADPDGSYDFSEIPRFLKELEQGADFVIGNRFKGKMEKGAMPFLHKKFGTPLLSFLHRLFFKNPCEDINSGMRAIRKEKYEELNLKTTGMEFASEMIINAVKNKLIIKEIPIDYNKRIGKSKIKTFSDGWRHLKFMLLNSPEYLFILPGLIMLTLGTIISLILTLGNPKLLGLTFSYHPIFIGITLTIIGYQTLLLGIFSKKYASIQFKEKSRILDYLKNNLSLKKATIIGFLSIILGFLLYLIIFIKWINSKFGSLNQVENLGLALILIILGIQTISSAWLMEVMEITKK